MELRQLTKIEFETYIHFSLESYVNELVKSGFGNIDEAKKNADETFKRILPKGMNTEGNYFNYAYEDGKRVGFIWYSIRGKDTAFIYDFYIEENMRRQGFGRKVLLECERKVKEKGIKHIKLHVFGHNKGAYALYESLNYYPTNIQMKKDL